MLARIWRGVTPQVKAAEYLEYLKSTGVKDLRATPGNRGVLVLLRQEKEQCEFITLSLWESMEAVRAFAGEDVEAARYYPKDPQFLLYLEPKVTHYALGTELAEPAGVANAG